MAAIASPYPRPELVRGQQCAEARLANGATRAAPERTLDRLPETARAAPGDVTGVAEVYRQDVYVPADPQEQFGFRSAIGGVVIESARPGSPIKAGEFLLGYLTRPGRPPPMPQPEALAETAPTRRSASSTRTRPASAPSSRRARLPQDRRLATAKMVGR
jgi:hypothetical protein